MKTRTFGLWSCYHALYVLLLKCKFFWGIPDVSATFWPSLGFFWPKNGPFRAKKNPFWPYAKHPKFEILVSGYVTVPGMF